MTNLRMFVISGLLLTAGLALFVSPWASSQPDGLERVATDEGFMATAEDHTLDDGPLADYRLAGVEDERAGTAIAGAIGVAITFALGMAAFAAIRRRRDRSTSVRDRSAGAGA